MENLIIAPIHLAITIYIWTIIASAILSFLQVDPNQPLVEFIERVTQPAFRVIRQRMPWVVISGIDLSPLLLIVALQFLDTMLIAGPLVALVQVIQSILFGYLIIVIAASVLSFVQIDPYNPFVVTINRLTQPAFQFLRRRFPFLVVSGIDLSPLVIIIGIQLVNSFLDSLIRGF